MSTNDSLLKKRAMLESMMQDYAIAGLPLPQETEREFASVVEEIENRNIVEEKGLKPWTQWLGAEIDHCTLDRMLLDDSYSYLLAGTTNSAEGSGATSATGKHSNSQARDGIVRHVFRLAKDGRQTKAPEKLTLTHSTQCLKIVPFETAPVTVTGNDLIALQYQRLRSIADGAIVPVEGNSEQDGASYYKMPFIHGRLMRDVIFDTEISDQDRLETILKSFVIAAKHLHRLKTKKNDFYHGNLKPENILVTDTGVVFLDPGYFGPLKAVEGEYTSCMVSTVAYYPFLEVDDLLALGISFFEAITKIHPFNQKLALPTSGESFAPTRLDTELCDMVNFKRSLLEPYVTPLYLLQSPSTTCPQLTEAFELVLLKGLRVKIDSDGVIHSDPGFVDFQDFGAKVQSLLEAEIDQRSKDEKSDGATKENDTAEEDG